MPAGTVVPMAQPKPKTPEQRRSLIVVSSLTMALFLIVMGLCWWGWTLLQDDKFGAFLAVMTPACVLGIGAGIPLNRRLRRLSREMSE